MNSTEKGDNLEDSLYRYLLEQLDQDENIYGIYSAKLCEIHKKKRYYCNERKRDIEFDIVVEVRGIDREAPHLYLIFECKNHKRPVQERDVRDFSDKLGELFRHSAKGVIVSSSKLQSGAQNIAKARGLGIAKFNENGINVIADRTGNSWTERGFVETQISSHDGNSKPLKFSAYIDGRFMGCFTELLQFLTPNSSTTIEHSNTLAGKSVPIFGKDKIRETAKACLDLTQYQEGAVNLEEICSALSLNLIFSDVAIQDSNGKQILGSANFEKQSIEINLHGNANRERFTIAHEIGHFRLNHGEFLRSDTVIEQDLFADSKNKRKFNYDLLEQQANTFASELLLPDPLFFTILEKFRHELEIRDKGYGYIFVDDQPCNRSTYYQLLNKLSAYFEVSKQAIEVKLKTRKLVTDHRRGNHVKSAIDNFFSRLR